MTTETEIRTLELAFGWVPPDRKTLVRALKLYKLWELKHPSPAAREAGFLWGVRVAIPVTADANWHVQRLIHNLRVPNGTKMGTVDSAKVKADAKAAADAKRFDPANWPTCEHCHGTGREEGEGSFEGISIDCGWCENGKVEP